MSHLRLQSMSGPQICCQVAPQLSSRSVLTHVSKGPSTTFPGRSQLQRMHGVAISSSNRHTYVLQPLQHHQSCCVVAAAENQQLQQQQRRRRCRTATAAAALAAEAEDPGSSTAASTSDVQQAAPQDQLGHIDLPPARSAAAWLNDLSETQLQQQAQDWGYQQVGRPLPEGLSLTAIADTIPEEHFALDLLKAVGYLAMSLGVMALGYCYLWYWHSICPLWQQIACWVVIGTGYFGVFQSAVDCAHFAFWPQRPLVQDLLGATLMAPALMSYEVFRLKYFNHLMCTNQLYEDTDAWHPLLPADLADLPPWRRALLQLLSATPLKFFSSVGQWFRSLEAFDLKLHPPEARPWVWLSYALPLGFVGVVWPAIVAAGGLGSWVSWWLGPWLVFHGWLSVLSLVQHTGPHIPWTEEGLTYDQAQATINGTVTLLLPQWLEVLLHHANYHLPTHVSISIPSYNLKGAHCYLQQRLGKYLTTATLNPQLLRNLMTAWLVYDEKQQRYVDFDQAEELVEQYKQQQQQQQQQAVKQAEDPSSSSSSGVGPSSNGTQPDNTSSSNDVSSSSSSSSSSIPQRLQPAEVRQHSSSPAAAFGI